MDPHRKFALTNILVQRSVYVIVLLTMQRGAYLGRAPDTGCMMK